MMPPAATLNCATSHGKPLSPGPGSLNVFIGGNPAWRANSDFHGCPLKDPKPHVGGMVAKGSMTVFINNLPATRLGDTVMESPGGPNAIVQGVVTVLIGG